MNEQNLAQLLSRGDLAEAFNLLNQGEKLPKTTPEFNKAQIYDRLIKEKQYNIINHLLNDKTIETDVYEMDKFDQTIFQSIVRYLADDEESNAFFRELVSKFDNLNDEVNTKTLLSYFFQNGASLNTIKILIDAGCNSQFKNNADENYIHEIVKNNLRRFDLNDQQVTDLMLGYIDILLNEGVDVDGQNVVQKTPLIAAIESNKKQYIAYFLEHGADANHQDNKGNTPFYYAIVNLRDPKMYDIMREFATPDFDTINKDQVSILFEYARMTYNGSDINLLIKLIEDGADLYQNSIYYATERTPLDMIAEKDAEVLEAVLETGKVDINQQDHEGNTLLHKVCVFNVNYEAEKAKQTYRKVKLLLEHGADPKLTNDQDKTAEMLASDDNLKIKTVELLMKQS